MKWWGPHPDNHTDLQALGRYQGELVVHTRYIVLGALTPEWPTLSTKNIPNDTDPQIGAVGGQTLHRSAALLGGVGSGSYAAQCLISLGLQAVEFVLHTTSPHGRSRQLNSCITPLHSLAAVGYGTRALHRLGGPGGGTQATHSLAAIGRWLAELVLRTATLLGCRGQWNSCLPTPHYVKTAGGRTGALHRRTCGAQWAVELLHCSTALLGGGGAWNIHRKETHVGEEWALGLLWHTATMA